MKTEMVGRCTWCKKPIWPDDDLVAEPNDGTPEDGPGRAWLWHVACSHAAALEAERQAEEFDAFERSLFASQDEYEAEKAAYEAWLTEEVDA